MKPNDIVRHPHTDNRINISWRNAYHQAGHAAAIYLVNKQKLLPKVPFQIVIKPQESTKKLTAWHAGFYSKYTAKVEGGRLIKHLPSLYAEATQGLSWYEETELRCAFETDVINLLAGPLAEAKYLSMRDGEPFNANLINLSALRYYGGSPDIEFVNGYMEGCIPKDTERKQKLDELFLAAFNFVNERPVWLKITDLADFIQAQPIGTIPCGELAPILGERMTEIPKRQLVAEHLVTG
jgi:hypothetical protein